MWNHGLYESQAGIKIAGRNISNFRYADDTTNTIKRRGTKESLDEGEKKSERAGLKLNIKNLGSWNPVQSSWKIQGGKVEAVKSFLFLGSKITADGDHSHKIKRYLILGSKVLTNLDSVFKSRDIDFTDKGPYSQSDLAAAAWCFQWSRMDLRVRP